MPVRLYGRYRSAGAGEGARCAATSAASRSSRRSTLELPGGRRSNPEIERMWAWHRVDSGCSRRRDRERLARAAWSTRSCGSARATRSSPSTPRSSCWRTTPSTSAGRSSAATPCGWSATAAAQARVRDELERIRDKALAGLGPVEVEKRASVNPVPATSPPPTSAGRLPLPLRRPSATGATSISAAAAPWIGFAVALALLLAAASLRASR